MPPRRRSTMSRSPIERFQMWNAKMKEDVYATQLSATKPLALPKVASYMVTHEYLISVVKNITSKMGVEASRMQEYMWYAQKMEKLVRTYKSEALQKESDSLYLWYLARGLNDIALRAIAQALGIKISTPETIMEKIMTPLLLKIIAEGSITTNGQEQTILEYHGLAVISGYIDLSNMELEDTVIVRAYIKIDEQSDWVLYRPETFIGKQTEPALYVMPRLSAKAFKVTLQQTTGTYKTYKYIFTKGV